MRPRARIGVGQGRVMRSMAGLAARCALCAARKKGRVSRGPYSKFPCAAGRVNRPDQSLIIASSASRGAKEKVDSVAVC